MVLCSCSKYDRRQRLGRVRRPPREDGPQDQRKEFAMPDNEQVVTDPVCRMQIKPSEAVASAEHDGTTYYFCSQDCADSFNESPEDYV